MMKKINSYITEKLKINKQAVNAAGKHTDSRIAKLAKEIFSDAGSKDTVNMVIDFIRKSVMSPYNESIFAYWEMGIKDNVLTCMHDGWSTDNVGYRKIQYVDKVVDNYNDENGTKIKAKYAGWMREAGIPIYNILEISVALSAKFDDYEPLDNLVSVADF